MGAQLVKEASSKTSDVAGDGTTTAIVLAEAIYSEGVKNVIAGANPVEREKRHRQSSRGICKALDELATKIKKPEEIKQIATISANNDPEIGAIIAEAMEKVGKDGTITIAEAKASTPHLDVVEGLQFDKGYLSPYFVTNPEKMTAELDNAHLHHRQKNLFNKEMVPILEISWKKGKTASHHC